MISITASHEDHNIWVQDLTKAYIKGYDLELGEYIKPAEQFKIAAHLHKKINLYMAYPNLKILVPKIHELPKKES